MIAWPVEPRIWFEGGGIWWPNHLKMGQVEQARAMGKEIIYELRVSGVQLQVLHLSTLEGCRVQL